MSKNKRKKYKPHKKHYPPLSKADKCIETILIFLGLIITFAFLGLRYKWTRHYFFAQPNVLAYSPSASLLAMIPFTMTAIISLAGIIPDMLISGKHPIFGNPKVDYYDSKYLFTLPLFDKRYSFTEYKQKMHLSKASKRTIIAFITVLLLTYIISLFGIFGRTELKSSSIEIYSCLNNHKEQYSYREVVSYDIESHRGSIFSKAYYPPSIWLKLNLDNGKSMSFEYEDFNCNPYSIQEVTERLAHAEKHTDDTFLDEFFDEYNFTAAEKEVVLNLFSE